MQRFLLTLCLLATTPAWCEDIVDVLRRSQDMRLAAFRGADDGQTVQVVRAGFDKVMAALPHGAPAELHVIKGLVMAETLHGHIVVANEALAELPEDARLFIIAHELGHVMQQHWLQMAMLYQKWVPGSVTQEHTDAINASLQREASELAHRQEYEADAFAARALTAMGRCQEPSPSRSADTGADVEATSGMACHDALLAVFRQPGASRDTLTHPRASKRLAALQAHAYDASMVSLSGPANPPPARALASAGPAARPSGR